MPNTPDPTNKPTPISEWIKRAADTAEFVEKVVSSKEPPANTPPTPDTPAETKTTLQSVFRAILHGIFIVGSITIIVFGLRFSLLNLKTQATHTTITPEQYHYTNTPSTNASNFAEIQQCIQQQQSCNISNDVFENATNISLDGYLRHQHKNNNNGLWISNGHNGHPEIVYILFPNDPTPYMISQEFFPGKDIAIYTHDHDIPLYHVDSNNGQNKPTDGEKAAGVIGSILFHAIL